VELFPVPAQADIVAGLMVLLRVSSMVLFLPVLGHQVVPTQVKIGLIGMITLLIFPVVRHTLPEISLTPLALALMAGQELLIGGMIAMLAQLMFGAIQMAGQVMSYQMGMAIANVFDPASNSQIGIVGQIAVVLAMLMWMIVGAHHAVLLSLADSFTLFPMGHAWSMQGWDTLNNAAAGLFSLSIRLCAPILLLMTLCYAALGLLSRAVPQIQIFFVSFPLTISLGLIVFTLSLPAFISLIGDTFKGFAVQVPRFLQILAGG